MVDFLSSNIPSIALLIVTMGVLFYLYKTGRNVLVKRILKELVVKAESYYQNGNGARKKDYVIREFYKKTKLLNIFLSRKELDDLIEILVRQMKNHLS